MVEPEPRSVIAHIHLFKNAGTSVERALQSHFGDRWLSFDKPGAAHRIVQGELVSFLVDNPNAAAISSHQLRPPVQSTTELNLLPVVFLRHPIDRIRSAYDFERHQGGVSPSSKAAAESTFAEWIEFHRDRGSVQCENFQTYGLTTLRNDNNGAPLRKRPIDEHLEIATRFIESLPVVGVVEQFDKSLGLIGRWLQQWFPGFDPAAEHRNVTAIDGSTLQQRLDEVRSRLGGEVFGRLIDDNTADIELHRRAVARLESC